MFLYETPMLSVARYRPTPGRPSPLPHHRMNHSYCLHIHCTHVRTLYSLHAHSKGQLHSILSAVLYAFIYRHPRIDSKYRMHESQPSPTHVPSYCIASLLAKYCDEHVSLSVCLSVCSDNSKPQGQYSPNFYACCLWPWLGPPFRFCG